MPDLEELRNRRHVNQKLRVVVVVVVVSAEFTNVLVLLERDVGPKTLPLLLGEEAIASPSIENTLWLV